MSHKGVFAILDEACLTVGKVTDEVCHFYLTLSYLVVKRSDEEIIMMNINDNRNQFTNIFEYLGTKAILM